MFLFFSLPFFRPRPHSRRDGAAQEWRQRQREDESWRDAVVSGEGGRSRAHGRVAQGQWRQLTRRLNSMILIDLRSQQQQQTTTFFFRLRGLLYFLNAVS